MTDIICEGCGDVICSESDIKHHWPPTDIVIKRHYQATKGCRPGFVKCDICRNRTIPSPFCEADWEHCLWCSSDHELVSDPKHHVAWAAKFGQKIAQQSHLGSTGPAINDFTCPHCRNTRCSKTEKKCWLCGESLH
jgi:hypothetical protein